MSLSVDRLDPAALGVPVNAEVAGPTDGALYQLLDSAWARRCRDSAAHWRPTGPFVASLLPVCEGQLRSYRRDKSWRGVT
jgi:hypothetical protein